VLGVAYQKTLAQLVIECLTTLEYTSCVTPT